MNTKSLDKSTWMNYLDRFSKVAGACSAEVEVAGLDIGDQIEAEWLTLTGISYDPNDDIIAIEMESEDDKSVEHLIHRPLELVVQEDTGGVESITVVDADGRKQIVRLKKALLLPAP